MREDVYTRIDDVPADHWDAIAPADFFFQRAFLRVMEDSAVEHARYRYLVMREGATAVALAVVSAFTLKLDLLSGDPWIIRLRRWFPTLLDLPIVCCGVPASFGQHHLHVVRPELTAAAVRCVHRCMNTWADEADRGMLVWKEWNPTQAVREHACREGYVALPTIPDHVLSRLPGNIDALVASMRSAYRRKYRTAVALMAGTGPVWTDGSLRLEEGRFTVGAARQFYAGYTEVMARTRVKLETYPEPFFVNLAQSTLDARQLRLTNEVHGQSLTALLIPSGKALNFALVAKDRDHYADALYTVLLQCIVLYGIRSGFTEVRLGQTSSYAKCSVGARPRRLEAFIRMRSSLKHRALARFGTALFPEVTTPAMHVFRVP